MTRKGAGRAGGGREGSRREGKREGEGREAGGGRKEGFWSISSQIAQISFFLYTLIFFYIL